MDYDIEKYLPHYPNLQGMMENVPKQLWNIFLPSSVGGLPDMEANVMLFKKRAREREQAMALQKLCGLPFRPNEQLNITEAKVRIQELKQRELYRRFRNNEDEEEEN